MIFELRQRTKELNHKKTETKDEEVNQRKGKGKDKYSFGPNFEAHSLLTSFEDDSLCKCSSVW